MLDKSHTFAARMRELARDLAASPVGEPASVIAEFRIIRPVPSRG